MYTAMSKFKIRNGYGAFSIPKPLLVDLGWKRGDFIMFNGLSGEVIMMRKVCTLEEFQKLKEEGEASYNKDWIKKISKLGGDKETLGIRTFPKPLLIEFKVKNDGKIYFLPAMDTWLNQGRKIPNSEKETLFAAFNKQNLEKWNKLPEEDKEKEQREFKMRLADKNHYNLRFFRGRSEISGENSERSKRRMQWINETINKDQILAINTEIDRVKKELMGVKLGNFKAKKGIARTLKNYIKSLKSKLWELKKNPEMVFKELPEEKMRKGGIMIRI